MRKEWIHRRLRIIDFEQMMTRSETAGSTVQIFGGCKPPGAGDLSKGVELEVT